MGIRSRISCVNARLEGKAEEISGGRKEKRRDAGSWGGNCGGE